MDWIMTALSSLGYFVSSCIHANQSNFLNLRPSIFALVLWLKQILESFCKMSILFCTVVLCTCKMLVVYICILCTEITVLAVCFAGFKLL